MNEQDIRRLARQEATSVVRVALKAMHDTTTFGSDEKMVDAALADLDAPQEQAPPPKGCWNCGDQWGLCLCPAKPALPEFNCPPRAELDRRFAEQAALPDDDFECDDHFAHGGDSESRALCTDTSHAAKAPRQHCTCAFEDSAGTVAGEYPCAVHATPTPTALPELPLLDERDTGREAYAGWILRPAYDALRSTAEQYRAEIERQKQRADAAEAKAERYRLASLAETAAKMEGEAALKACEAEREAARAAAFKEGIGSAMYASERDEARELAWEQAERTRRTNEWLRYASDTIVQLKAERDRLAARIDAAHVALGDRFMLPPDGGDPTLAEQIAEAVRRLGAAEARLAEAESQEPGEYTFGGPFAPRYVAPADAVPLPWEASQAQAEKHEAALREARAKERERCAKVCDQIGLEAFCNETEYAADDCAAAIRALGDEA